MARPPRDDEHTDLLELVAEAIEKLDLNIGRDALLAGVREALGALDDPEGRRVVVIKGDGREDDENDDDDDDDEGPDLRVVDTEEVERFAARAESGPKVRVKVVRSEAARGVEGSLEVGRIAVQPTTPAAWQTVLRAPDARPYRLVCDAGRLQVAADGVSVEVLSAGQTIDLEARLIRVAAHGDEVAAGRYLRL